MRSVKYWNKRFKNIKIFFTFAFIFLCITLVLYIAKLFRDILNGMGFYATFQNIRITIAILVMCLAALYFKKFIISLENKSFLNSNTDICDKIAKIFIFGIINDFFMYGALKDGAVNDILNQSPLFYFFVYNYVIFNIIPYLIEVAINLNEDSKSII
ncbi:hypothetical protein [Peptostreptococcus equinus]|uniref:Uncharacterized protein n=1 Tax=Peptostreptococcus equinus TaxID=3003601 RepID=A0ABY7JR12_9FIRM|nr:hypothetical protein [Peptostreptococcus sp. CBA3647]WAW15805.1 hypothetical protein O0R46_04955 [Peptostreptococcus sp. CBA3647]